MKKTNQYFSIQFYEFKKFVEELCSICDETSDEQFIEAYQETLSLFYKRNKQNYSWTTGQRALNHVVPINYLNIEKTSSEDITKKSIQENVNEFIELFNQKKKMEIHENNFDILYWTIHDILTGRKMISNDLGKYEYVKPEDSIDNYSKNLIRALGTTMIKEQKILSLYLCEDFIEQSIFISEELGIDDSFINKLTLSGYIIEEREKIKSSNLAVYNKGKLSISFSGKNFGETDLYIYNKLLSYNDKKVYIKE